MVSLSLCWRLNRLPPLDVAVLPPPLLGDSYTTGRACCPSPLDVSGAYALRMVTTNTRMRQECDVGYVRVCVRKRERKQENGRMGKGNYETVIW